MQVLPLYGRQKSLPRGHLEPAGMVQHRGQDGAAGQRDVDEDYGAFTVLTNPVNKINLDRISR